MEVAIRMDKNLSFNHLNEKYNGSHETQSAAEVVNGLRHSTLLTVVLVIINTPLALVGICANILIVLVLSKQRKKTVATIFIRNLAVADFFVSLFCVLPTLLDSIYVSWFLGPIMCKAVSYVQGVSVCASVYSLVAISLDRFRAILHPMKLPGLLSKFHANFIVSFIWIFALFITLPKLIVFQLEISDEDNQEYCVESWTQPVNNLIFFVLINFSLCYVFPLAIILFTNFKIYRHVGQRNASLECSNTGDIQRVHEPTRSGVSKMLLMLTLPFFLLWLPLYIISFLLKFGGPLNEQKEINIYIAMPFAQWFGALNICANPLILCYLDKKFIKSLKSCFRWVFIRNQPLMAELDIF